MAGDPTKIRIWEQGDVFVFDPDVAFVEATHIPATIDDPLHEAWLPSGLMLGDPGVEFPRDIEKTEINAWQLKRVRTKYKNGKVDANFSLMEDNDVTRDLIDPEGVPGAKKRYLAFVFVDSDTGHVERRFTNLKSDVWVTNDNHPEDPDARPCECSLYPDSSGKIFTIQEGIPA
ncbi:hypothetical protein [Mycolicibacterium sp. XJ1819]